MLKETSRKVKTRLAKDYRRDAKLLYTYQYITVHNKEYPLNTLGWVGCLKVEMDIKGYIKNGKRLTRYVVVEGLKVWLED